MLVMRQREFGGVRNGVVDAAIRNTVQEYLGVGAGIFDPREIRQPVASGPQGLCGRAARCDFQIAVAYLAERFPAAWRRDGKSNVHGPADK